jgi:hypothetical protein
MSSPGEYLLDKQAKNCLEIANELVGGDRNADYGHPREDFTRTAKMWSALLGTEVTPEQVGLCMIAVKLSRETHRHKPDNLTDIAGYARTLEMIYDARCNDKG